MIKKQVGLARSYRKYRSMPRKRRGMAGFFSAFIPEIVYRTTRLEGESVTRRMVSWLFK